MPGPIGTLGSPLFPINNVNTFENANLRVLITGADASNPRGTFRLMNGSAGYLVPVGKVLRVVGVHLATVATSGASVVQLAQTDNDVGHFSSTAFTNPVWAGGGSAAVSIMQFVPSGNMCEVGAPVLFNVAAGKYVSIQHNLTAGTRYILFGYEENV